MNENELRSILDTLSNIRAHTFATQQWVNVLHIQTQPGNKEAIYSHCAATDHLEAADKAIENLYCTLTIALLSERRHRED